jgi:GntR family transcriptional regulator / MocR family aminotransferase
MGGADQRSPQVIPASSLKLVVDAGSFVPVHRQISDSLRRSIIAGEIPLSAVLPSVRELGNELQISRSTIVRSFEDLASQGYLRIFRGSHTAVCERLPGELSDELRITDPETIAHEDQSLVLSTYAERLVKLYTASVQPECHAEQLNYGGPSFNLAPINQWKQLLERNCRLKDLSRLEYAQEPLGYPPLREAYVAYLTRARAVRCTASQVIVFSAREMRLDLLSRVLIEPGDCVATEEPGWPAARQRFASHGAKVVPIPVDYEGLSVSHLSEINSKFKFVYLSPSYSEPTGAALSMRRRRQLLDWAQRTGTFIIEDDYASEYRYNARPLPSLQGMDQSGLVIHLSCLWKVLFPVVRLGFLVVPNRLLKTMTLAKALVEADLPLLDQFALTDFINEGHLERQIRKTRKIYGNRRRILVESLIRQFAGQVRISPEAAGFELLIKVDSSVPDQVILERACREGVPLISTRSYYAGQPRSSEFMLAFAQLEEEDIDTMVRCLHGIVRGDDTVCSAQRRKIR